MGTPDWNGWLASQWGPSVDLTGFGDFSGFVNNIVVGSNPPYFIQDFFAFYPKWGGPPLAPVPTATLVAGNQVANVSSTAGMAVGNPVAGANIPDGTFIQAIGTGAITLSNAPINSASNVPLTVWNAPLVPIAVLQVYIALASASLVQGKWLEQWTFAMALFVAHFADLYARSEGAPASTATQAAGQGLAFGILIAKSVGDVSASYQLVGGLEDWGAWNLTVYGQQLATMARIVGMGPMMLW
jgi:hypothetical protein